MATGAQNEVPAGMQRLSRRFERWRSSHRGRLPIPKRLWASAAESAREYGVFRASKVLHLEYGKLKRLAETAADSRRPIPPPTAFLEVIFSSSAGLSGCLIGWFAWQDAHSVERGHGSRPGWTQPGV